MERKFRRNELSPRVLVELATIFGGAAEALEKCHWTRFQGLIEFQSPNFVLGSQGSLRPLCGPSALCVVPPPFVSPGYDYFATMSRLEEEDHAADGPTVNKPIRGGQITPVCTQPQFRTSTRIEMLREHFLNVAHDFKQMLPRGRNELAGGVFRHARTDSIWEPAVLRWRPLGTFFKMLREHFENVAGTFRFQGIICVKTLEKQWFLKQLTPHFQNVPATFSKCCRNILKNVPKGPQSDRRVPPCCHVMVRCDGGTGG